VLDAKIPVAPFATTPLPFDVVLSALTPVAPVAVTPVPLLFALHIASMVTLPRAPRRAPSAVGPVNSGTTPRAGVVPSPASRAG